MISSTTSTIDRQHAVTGEQAGSGPSRMDKKRTTKRELQRNIPIFVVVVIVVNLQSVRVGIRGVEQSAPGRTQRPYRRRASEVDQAVKGLAVAPFKYLERRLTGRTVIFKFVQRIARRFPPSKALRKFDGHGGGIGYAGSRSGREVLSPPLPLNVTLRRPNHELLTSMLSRNEFCLRFGGERERERDRGVEQ